MVIPSSKLESTGWCLTQNRPQLNEGRILCTLKICYAEVEFPGWLFVRSIMTKNDIDYDDDDYDDENDDDDA